jgi:uncharacterized protein YbjT (DUF2867 family)
MILVTGSTGAIGSEVVPLLSRASTPARALIRNPNQRKELPGITWVAGDLGKPETLASALAGEGRREMCRRSNDEGKFEVRP